MINLLWFILIRYLFFVNGGSKPKIVRARMDGSERMDFVLSTAEHPLISPNGLALDKQTGDLYWCDKVIEKVSHDGVRETLLEEGLHDCTGLAIHEDNIYWADR